MSSKVYTFISVRFKWASTPTSSQTPSVSWKARQWSHYLLLYVLEYLWVCIVSHWGSPRNYCNFQPQIWSPCLCIWGKILLSLHLDIAVYSLAVRETTTIKVSILYLFMHWLNSLMTNYKIRKSKEQKQHKGRTKIKCILFKYNSIDKSELWLWG